MKSRTERYFFLIVVFAACLTLVSTAEADLLYNNGVIAQPVPTSFLLNMASSCCEVLDDFGLTTNAIVTGFSWSGFEDPGAFPGPVPYASTSYRIIEGASPQSGTLVISGTTVASRVANGISVPNFSFSGYNYVVTGLNIPVTVGKRYWLGLGQIAPAGSSTAFAMAPSTGSPLGDGMWQQFFGTFLSSTAEMVFSINGTPTQTTQLSCVGFEAPMDAGPVRVLKNKKRALPLKAKLVDSVSGQQVTNVDISVPPVVQVSYAPDTGGSVINVTDEALPVGLGTEGNQFVFTSEGKWQFNLKTTNFNAPGTYTITMVAGDTYVINPTCTATIRIQ